MRQDEMNTLLDKDSSDSKRSAFGRWLRGETDLINENLYMKKACEDHVKKEPDEEILKNERKKLKTEIYDRTANEGLKKSDIVYRVSAVLFCILLAVVMTFAMSYAPGQSAATPANSSEVPARYIEKGLDETGAVNIVAGMILDYRAFDTLGESHVLFIATITVLIMMRNDKKKKKIDDFVYEPNDDAILQVVSRVLVPVIMIFGVYVILNGHISPGGGFSGGAVIGAGLILYVSAFGFEKTGKFFTEKFYKLVTFCSLAFYALAKCYSFFCGANHLDSHISNGIPGKIISAGLILPLNIAVGLVVACTMYAFYAHFRKGGF